ncbi:MAG: hypothetical protein WA555_03270 [Candidatus Sulfotelmatobacter sp.]
MRVSASPFTQEQIAVYQAFLADYRRGGDGRTINVAEQTDILEPDDGDYSGCMKKFPRTRRGKMVHRLTEEFANENRLRLVDPKTHKISDPEEGWMRRGQSVEGAVKAGFESGLLTLSEIIFDAKHGSAALHYSFVCGKLCAHFETVVYEKRHGIWKASKLSCGYGIS